MVPNNADPSATSGHRLILQHDPLTGQRYVPNQRARVPFDGGGYRVRTNSRGFRSDWEFEPAKGSRQRVLFLGDSYTAGYGVDNAERYPELLGQDLGVEIYNAGLTGTGTDQQVLAYENYLNDIEVDLVVLAVLVENIERNKARHHLTLDPHTNERFHVQKPYFELAADGNLVLRNSPVGHERTKAEQASIYGPSHHESPRDRLGARVAELMRHERTRSLRRTVGAPIVDRAQKLTGYQPYPDYGDRDSVGWRLMAGIIDRLARAVDGVPLLVLPIPTFHYIRSTPLDSVYQAAFESLADPARGIFVADITTPLRSLSTAVKGELAFKTDAHFSRKGHRIVSEIVGDAVTTVEGFGRKPSERPTPTVVAPKAKPEYVLGVSCFYHNSAAAILRDGELVAAVEEERFTRDKADRRFPLSSINYCLEEADIGPNDLSTIVYYDNAYLTFERLLHSQLALGRSGGDTWERVIPGWLNQKLFIPDFIRNALSYDGIIHHASHHRSHAASAFFPSPFEESAVLTIDGVGEWATATIGHGRHDSLDLLTEMRFPHSVGLLYSAFTQFVGFKVNNGEYKMMGLAPYGDPVYSDLIRQEIVDVKTDGSIELNLDYFAFLQGQRMTTPRFDDLFGGPGRGWDQPVTRREMDISASIQQVTEDIVMKMAVHAHELTGQRRLCLAGGVALNCVANGLVQQKGPFDELWIQPAAGDSGGALGAALDYWHTHRGKPRKPTADGRSVQQGSYWGPEYSDTEIRAFLDSNGVPYTAIDPEKRADEVARHIEAGKVVGHFSGRCEFGPRALGARSILGDARNPETQTTLNLRIKFRESFRPFAPTVLAEEVDRFFDLDAESPYMLIVAPVLEARRLDFEHGPDMDAYDIVRQPRSDVPAITHVDYSARIQTLRRPDHPAYYDVISAFRDLTGIGLVVNTSFNVRGEPIVCTPYDAYSCFMRTDMDVLVMGNTLLHKDEQPDWHEAKGHIEERDKPSTEPIESSYLAEIRKIFHRSVVPIVDRLPGDPATSRILTTSRPSTWTDCRNERHRFEIPAVLQEPGRAPQTIARAVCSFWEPGPVTEALEPVVEQLVEAAQSRQSDDRPTDESHVSEHIYVLY